MPYPIKLSAKTEWFPVLALIAAAAFGAYFYSRFPAKVPIHWDASGHANGYSGRLAGAAMPALMIGGVYLLFLLLPMLDPKRDRYLEFAKIFVFIRDIIIAFMLAIGLTAGFAGLGYDVKIESVVPMIVGIMFLLMGNYMGKIRNNWFMGIRNPWTLSSENVWNKTHRLGGWLFSALGLGVVICAFFAKAILFPLLIGGIIAVVAVTTVYSYIEYAAEKRT